MTKLTASATKAGVAHSPINCKKHAKLIIYFTDLLLLMPDPCLCEAEKMWFFSPKTADGSHEPLLHINQGRTSSGLKSWPIHDKHIWIKSGVLTGFEADIAPIYRNKYPKKHNMHSLNWALNFREINKDCREIYAKDIIFKDENSTWTEEDLKLALSLINARFMLNKGVFQANQFPRTYDIIGNVLNRTAYTFIPKKTKSQMYYSQRRAIAHVFKSVSCIENKNKAVTLGKSDFDSQNYEKLDIYPDPDTGKIELVFKNEFNTSHTTVSPVSIYAKSLHFHHFFKLLKNWGDEKRYVPRHLKFSWFGSKKLDYLINNFDTPNLFSFIKLKRSFFGKVKVSNGEPGLKCEPPMAAKES